MTALATDQTQPILSFHADYRTLIDVVVHPQGSTCISIWIDHDDPDPEDALCSTEEMVEEARVKLSKCEYTLDRKVRWNRAGDGYGEDEWAASGQPETTRFTESWTRRDRPNTWHQVTLFYPNTDKGGE